MTAEYVPPLPLNPLRVAFTRPSCGGPNPVTGSLKEIRMVTGVPTTNAVVGSTWAVGRVVSGGTTGAGGVIVLTSVAVLFAVFGSTTAEAGGVTVAVTAR